MEAQCSTWPESFDQASMINATFDLATIDAEIQSPRKISQEEWQQVFDSVSAKQGGDNDVSADRSFSILSPRRSGSSVEFDHQAPRQSVERPVTLGAPPQMSHQSNDYMVYSYAHPEPMYAGTWSASNSSMPTYPPPPTIPEEEAHWFGPPVPHSQPMTMTSHTGLPAHIPSPFDSPTHTNAEHHLMSGPSPMLSAGSPHDSEYMDEGWSPHPGTVSPWPERLPSDEEDGLDTGDPCYAQLLYRCLKEAPDQIMSLKELYDWIKEHSQKAKDPANRGWQNSVRHNLSMNAAFERVPPRESHGVKKGSLWRLTASALRDGVISTTRYRKDPKHKPLKRAVPALKRQLSGAKGGQATRAAQRRQQQLREARSYPNLNSRQRQGQQQDMRYPLRQPGPNLFTPGMIYNGNTAIPFHQPPYATMIEQPSSPYFIGMDDTMSPAPRSAPLTPPQMLAMYDTQPKSSISDPNFEHIDFTNGGMIAYQDEFEPDTPSLGTERSYGLSEDGIPVAFSGDVSREATSFAMES
ncbi:hypothetical protein LTR78_003437 [Recurvomyces mirabilis]|uniref:Fork-head domain-containing protein n=1 Tax=Recurvomyces mirabilis TaxID=574656 RepID=A0AAE0WRR9_9PEZI|nr:hypothetical protein LTR78_003437 [Recurvomyces mirabilis]KAK5154529.1 hypothetical protein LTS14_006666 [Recurvomyces mirabilis]